MQGNIIYQKNWSTTILSSNIELYKKIHKDSPMTLFIGGVHGDEPEGVRLASEFLKWLLANEKNSKIKRSWALIPCLNVDGYKKNKRVNACGVDLNRNFPTIDWSPSAKAERYYPGPYAASELEVQSLVELIDAEKPQLIVHFHSWEPCVVYTGATAKHVAELFAQGNNYEVKEDIGYPTPGSLGQYGWHNMHIPVICIEENNTMKLNKVWGNFQKGLTEYMLNSDIKVAEFKK